MGSDLDQLIGQNLAALRGEMSQKALADEMRERGHKWSQATVWSVEKGDRPLKLTEAHDLEQILGVLVSSEWFRREPGLTTASRAVSELREARRQAVDALAEYFRARMDTWAKLSDAWLLMPSERGRLSGFITHALGGASSDGEWIIEEAKGRAVGSPKSVFGGKPGEPYPHGDETLASIQAGERAVTELLQEVEAHGVDQET